MKTKHLLIGILMVVIAGGIITACSDKGSGGKVLKDEHGEISHYTCPMHPQIHQDHPGECPICHMTLVPVYKEQAKPPESRKESNVEGPMVTITAERQQLIGIKTVTATRKTLTRDLRTTGRIAYDPELAVAQREFVEIVKNVPSLKETAMARLKLLGMNDTEIEELAKRKTVSSNLYLPTSAQPLWVYATLYESEMGLVQPGMASEITLPSGGTASWTGVVRAIDPVVDASTRSFRARIEIEKASTVLKPDTYVNVSIAVDVGERIAIPQSAVIDTGTRKIAFVVHDGDHFQSREIKTGPEAGDDIVVLEGIEEGEAVVASGTFMVDSESQLKAAIAGTDEKPSCPEGEYWDTSMNMCMPKIGK